MTRQVQRETLETIRSLVSDGLFELGDLSGEGGSFVAWSGSLDESIQKISDVYVANMTTRPHGFGPLGWNSPTRANG